MEKNPNHDFNMPIEKTTVALAKVILENLNKSSEDLIFEVKRDATAEEVAKQEEKFYDFCTETIKVLAASDIPADYATYPLERLIKFLTTAQAQIGSKVRGIETETLSRMYGVRSPLSGKFRKDVATFGTILSKLEDVKQATGNDDNDYYDLPEPVAEETAPAPDEPTESPYAENK